MKVLVDTNVALDILLNRSAFYLNSMAVFVLAEQKLITGHISASAITDIFYIAQKQLGKNAAQKAIGHLLQVFFPATVTGNNIYHALDLEWDDFEDSIQFTVGEAISADFIVTRNTQNFASGSIGAVTPEQLLQTITEMSDNN
jgi:predicted nucleic acid-binding protein